MLTGKQQIDKIFGGIGGQDVINRFQEPDGTAIRERDAAICAEISDADVSRIEAEMDAAHESFVTDRLKEKDAEARHPRTEL